MTRGTRAPISFLGTLRTSHQSVLVRYQEINDSNSDSDSDCDGDGDVVKVMRARVSFKPIVAAPALVIP